MKPLQWKDIKEQNEIASGWLLHYLQRRKTYFEAKGNFSEVSATVCTGIPHGSGTGNPTLVKAVDLSLLNNDELWIMTIEDTERILSPKKKIFLEVRRQAELLKHDGESGRPGWVVYTQMNYAEKICRIYGCEDVPSARTMQDWWGEIVDIAARVAIKRGCL